MLRRRAADIAEKEGLTLQQYNVLRILRDARAPLPTMKIAEGMIEPAPGITRLVGVLEKRGLLRREPWAGDRRCVLCRITPAGLQLLGRLDAAIRRRDDEMAAALDPRQAGKLVTLLERLREANESR